MELIERGTKVKVLGTDIKATVLGVCARGHSNVSYEISWWIQGERKECWVNDFEIEVYLDSSKKAGFVNYDTNTKLLK